MNQLKKKKRKRRTHFLFHFNHGTATTPKNKTEIVKSESTLSHLGSPLEEQKRATVTLQRGRGREGGSVGGASE